MHPGAHRPDYAQGPTENVQTGMDAERCQWAIRLRWSAAVLSGIIFARISCARGDRRVSNNHTVQPPEVIHVVIPGIKSNGPAM